jgi:surfactin synthase thioesterase subunit
MTLAQRYRFEPELRAGVRTWGGRGPRVLAFPPAGGNGSYFRPLAAALGEDWSVHAVDPPGHGLLQGPALGSVEALAALGRRLIPPGSEPLVLLGASLGGYVAHRLALALEADGEAAAAVVVLGTPAYEARDRCPSLRGLEGAALLARLEPLGGVAPELRQQPELLGQFLRAMAVDIEAFEDTPAPPGRLAAPLLAIAGREDLFSPPPLLEGWRTRGARAWTETVPGPHLFLPASAAQVALRLRALLASSVSGGSV